MSVEDLQGGYTQIVRVWGFRYREYICQLNQLLREYPFIESEPIGCSVLGKAIPLLRIGKGLCKIHVNAAMHANEWITAPVLLRFVEQYARSLVSSQGRWGDEAHQWWNKYTLFAVPMVNPDGVDLSQSGIERGQPWADELIRWNGGSVDFSRWKANIRGVDLNDQFPANWEEERIRRGKCHPAASDFGGDFPLSEPESAALAELTKRESFDYVVSLHSQGREIYWNYRGYEPPESEGIANRLAIASGYEAIKLSGSDAGYKDWYIQQYRRPGFTVEAGFGINPLPPQDFEKIYEEVSLILAELFRL